MALGGVCWTFHTSPLITRPIVGQVIKGCYVGCRKLVDGVPSGWWDPAWAPSSEECWKEVKRWWVWWITIIGNSAQLCWRHSQVGFCCWGRLPLCREWWQTAKPYWGPPIERTWRTQQEGRVRMGKDSTGVEASPNQYKLRWTNKYCQLRGLNHCPLAWELGTLPLDHLGFDCNSITVYCLGIQI